MLDDEEKKKLKISIIIPTLFIVVLWLIWLFDYVEHLDLYKLGVYPREIKGVFGILFSPFVHSDLNHLISNSIPLLILGTGTLYFYRSLAYKVIVFVWLISGFCVWIGARESYHIGASGIIYGLASFLFFSGAIRKDIRLSAISLLVVFLYGGLIWGIFPIFPKISWEFHFFGGFCGLVASIVYRREGPKTKVWEWDDDDNDDLETQNELDDDKCLENKIHLQQ
ncbi:MAG: rhomboid family intramembrane serine protease [Tenuifilaceae bacterium]